MEPNLLPPNRAARHRPLVNRATKLRWKRTWRSRLVATTLSVVAVVGGAGYLAAETTPGNTTTSAATPATPNSATSATSAATRATSAAASSSSSTSSSTKATTTSKGS